ncbi:hypothetical protein KGF54_003039 [Candida jiufengensis]|uniref:uncharacterized protein n=1 Tax=Candida jiufengensis TaxID=497108 RepID=UPI0022256FE9|nr:uncharacterized protein KGF54_003039 [Candida jiufengensis]KAI5953667.1 hypothetical protein KGF54_003039 [Candida jiufengensis]
MSSITSKTQITEKIIQLLKTLPKDRLKHYASFKDSQLQRFENTQIVQDISEKDLKLQYIALKELVNDKYKNYYKLDDKLLKPKGNPDYYNRLISEIKGEKKETLFTAIRTVRTLQGSKPLQSLLTISVLLSIYLLYHFNVFWFLNSSSTSTPEEINSLLQNKDTNIVALKKTELTNQGIQKPYLDDSLFHVRNWNLKGNTFVENDKYIRLTSTAPHLASNMFSKNPIEAESFEMELTFHIHNEDAKHGLVGDGLAVWFLDKPSDIGDVFGIENNFNGLGIMMDTYKNGKRGTFPFVNLMLGDGSTYYNKGTDGYETRLAGCTAKDLLNPASKETKMRLVYIKNGYLSIDFNYYGKHEDWTNCVTLTDVKLPHIKYLGLSAETGQLFENVDVIENKIFALFKPDGTFVESIDELDDLIKEQNEYDEEASSLNDINQKVENIKSKTGGRNRAFKRKLSTQRRRTLKRLQNAEKRIKQREKQARLEKYGDEDATFFKRLFSRLLWCLKIIIYIVIFVILIWFGLIIYRVQKQKRKSKSTGLLD